MVLAGPTALGRVFGPFSTPMVICLSGVCAPEADSLTGPAEATGPGVPQPTIITPTANNAVTNVERIVISPEQMGKSGTASRANDHTVHGNAIEDGNAHEHAPTRHSRADGVPLARNSFLVFECNVHLDHGFWSQSVLSLRFRVPMVQA